MRPESKKTQKNQRGDEVKSLGKALDILIYVAENPEGAGVSEISEALGINKATISKMLSTMTRRRFVRRDPQTRRYRAGYRLAELGTRLIESVDIRSEAHPHLKNLEKTVNEVINLAIYHNGEAIYVDKFEGTRSLRLHSRVGGQASLTCTAVGKVLAAFLLEQDRLALYDKKNPPERRTARSVASWDEFEAQCAEVRAQGYALDLEENVEGIVCVGAPLFDYEGRAAAAVSISCPTVRCERTRLMELKDHLIKTCAIISAECGYTDKSNNKEPDKKNKNNRNKNKKSKAVKNKSRS